MEKVDIGGHTEHNSAQEITRNNFKNDNGNIDSSSDNEDNSSNKVDEKD